MPVLAELPKIWTDNVRQAWELPRDMTVSEWADQFRVLPELTSAEPGQWSTDRTPYLRGIMNAFTDTSIDDITLMMSTQVGKTECMLNMAGYAVDQDPGPTMWVHTTKDLAREFCDERILPMILSSQVLKNHLTGNPDDITRQGIMFRRMKLHIGWAMSPSSLASKPVRYLFLDETDKYPRYAGREADPIKLATERTRTFWNRKIVKVSTPTNRDGYIFREFEKSDKRRFHVPCPHCGEYQVLIFKDRLRWPDDIRDPDLIEAERLAWYECVHCKGRIDDVHKQSMLMKGVWCPDECSVKPDGTIDGILPSTRHRGFWLNALYSPWLTFSDIAAEFLRSKGAVETLMNFVNSWLGEVFEEKTARTEPDKIRRLALTYESGTVPDGALVLTAGIDVQKDYMVYAIRAWGYNQESWQVRSGRVEEWEGIIDEVFRSSFARAGNAEQLQVRLVNIDTGHRTDEVYDLCRSFPGLARPVKGMSRPVGQPFRVGTIDKYPGSGIAIKGGLKLWHIDTHYFKDKINRLVHHADAGGGRIWHLHHRPSKDYCEQFCGEHKILIRDRKTGKVRELWQPVSSHAPAHFWDCEVYAAAAAEMLHVFTWRQPSSQVDPPREKRQESTRTRQGNWMQRTGSWMGHHD